MRTSGMPAEVAKLRTLGDINNYLEGACGHFRMLVAAGTPRRAAETAGFAELARRRDVLRRWRPDLAFGSYAGAVLTGVDFDALRILTVEAGARLVDCTNLGYAVALGVMECRAAGAPEAATAMLGVLQRHVGRVRADRDSRELDRLADKVYGPVRARQVRAERAARARFDALYEKVNGPGSRDRLEVARREARAGETRRERDRLARLARWTPQTVVDGLFVIESRAFGAATATRRRRWRAAHPGRPLPRSMKMPVDGTYV